LGVDNIQRYDDELVMQLLGGLDHLGYVLASPRSDNERSTLVLFTHQDPSRNATIQASLEQNDIHVAERDGKLRTSSHLYNTPQDIDRALEVLADFN
jgi:selenocysteine lyase/cysteine desulfurase